MDDFFKKYVQKLKEEKVFNKTSKAWEEKNPWAKQKKTEFWEECWENVKRSGLEFDGKHITINQNGVSYDYIAYKNRMLLSYPESQIDLELVYKGDVFSFEKVDGRVDYKHIMSNPFAHKDDDILGGYCVIKNKRGEFITTLSKAEIDKCKGVAKTSAIWDSWYAQMARKTVIKAAVKLHFDDIYTEMEEEDNKNYDLDKAPDDPKLPEALINAIESAESYEAVKAIYKREKDNLEGATLKAELLAKCMKRKEELEKANDNS